MSPFVRLTRTEVACFQSEKFAGEQRICPCAVLSSLSDCCVSCLTVCLPAAWCPSLTVFVQFGHDSVHCDSYSHSSAVLPLTWPRSGPFHSASKRERERKKEKKRERERKNSCSPAVCFFDAVLEKLVESWHVGADASTEVPLG